MRALRSTAAAKLKTCDFSSCSIHEENSYYKRISHILLLLRLLHWSIAHWSLRSLGRSHIRKSVRLTLLPPGNLALACRLVLGPPGLKLVRESLFTRLLSLGLVDTLHQDTLVLEDITLDLHVHVVVHVLIDLLGITVLAQ
jgi:hypothetical protein